VQVTTPEGEEPGYLVDLSFGGLFVSCSSVKPPGTALELRVRTPSLSRGLALRGRVVWTAPPTSGKAGGMGIALEI
jgi:Tfp pilus assembly protein PilZ